jgi:hypothetical protein
MKTFAQLRPVARRPDRSAGVSPAAWRQTPPRIAQTLATPALQAKLTIGAPHDRFEREAEEVAEAVLRMPSPESGYTPVAPGLAATTAGATVQRLCSACAAGGAACPECEEELRRQPAPGEEERLQAAARPGEAPTVTAPFERELHGLRGGGRPLSPADRAFFEPRFGRSFAEVRLHTGTAPARLARQVHARAFTLGRDIVFDSGEHAPDSPGGRRLLAHELTHVAQQSGAATPPGTLRRKVVDDDFHTPCRHTRPNAVADLRRIEAAAIRLGRLTATRIDVQHLLHPLVPLTGETPLLRHFRDVLWRRFDLDYNSPQVQAQWLPLLSRRYNLVADWMGRLNHRYRCEAPGQEPPGECRTRPNVGLAWTASGLNETLLCEAFWHLGADDQAETLLHEWFHFGFGFLGDCEQSRNVNNTVCYDIFAGELDGTATAADYAGCCRPPAGPLPPLAGAP